MGIQVIFLDLEMEEEGKENGVCTVKRDGARDSMAVKNNLM